MQFEKKRKTEVEIENTKMNNKVEVEDEMENIKVNDKVEDEMENIKVNDKVEDEMENVKVNDKVEDEMENVKVNNKSKIEMEMEKEIEMENEKVEFLNNIKEGITEHNGFVSVRYGNVITITLNNIALKEKDEDDEDDDGDDDKDKNINVIDLTCIKMLNFTEKKMYKSGLRLGKCNNLHYVTSFLKEIEERYQFLVNPRKQIGINLVEENMSVLYLSVTKVKDRQVCGTVMQFQVMTKEESSVLDIVNYFFVKTFDCIIIHKFVGGENLIRHRLASNVFDNRCGSISIFVGGDRKMTSKLIDDEANYKILKNGCYLYMEKKYIISHFFGISSSDDPNNTSFFITFKKLAN